MSDPNRGRFFAPLDLHFARFLAGLSTVAADEVFLAAALLSRATGAGDVCLDLAAVAGQPVPAAAGIDSPAAFPELGAWSAALRSSAVVGSPGQKRPLVLDGGNRLYLRRYWEYEHAAAESVRRRVGEAVEHLDTGAPAARPRRLVSGWSGRRKQLAENRGRHRSAQTLQRDHGRPRDRQDLHDRPAARPRDGAVPGTPAAHPPRSAHGQGRRPHAGVPEAGPGRHARPPPGCGSAPGGSPHPAPAAETAARLPVLPA